MQRGVSQYLYEAEKPRRRPQAEEVYRRVTDEAGALLGRFSEDAPGSLRLMNCEVWPVSGDGIEVPVVTVPFSSIDAWWLGAAKRLPRKGGGGFVAGILFPLGSE
jgi:hypothetical protein